MSWALCLQSLIWPGRPRVVFYSHSPSPTSYILLIGLCASLSRLMESPFHLLLQPELSFKTLLLQGAFSGPGQPAVSFPSARIP